ncbi:hypothetical protein AC578_3087 [Pseudocercospora eumusae]|uniref:Extracellular membrane protein CFEM domain-containing protein n=1 Tax=Pseudocercospora eumusae TaxID=321146 RepID=A0A139H1M4_9PEZI|nr:hypothetical protein AC578_3087 [Pseudocercospora eumusae]
MQSILLTSLFIASITATLNPALSNSKNRCPTTYNCDAKKISKDIQAAECSHNTRTHEDQSSPQTTNTTIPTELRMALVRHIHVNHQRRQGK